MAKLAFPSLRQQGRWPWQRHLHYRITLTYGLLFLIVLTLLMVYVGQFIYAVQLDQAKQHLEVQALLVTNAMEDPLSGYGPELHEYENRASVPSDNDGDEGKPIGGSGIRHTPVTPALAAAKQSPNAVRLQQIAHWYAADTRARVTIFDTQGRGVADSVYLPAKLPNELKQPELQAALKAIKQQDIRSDYFTGETTLFAAAPIRQGNQVIGMVRLSQPMNNITAPIRAILLSLALAGIGAIILATGLGIGISRRLVEPIQHLEKTALAIAHGDLSKQATVETTDEVGALADTFNYMIGELRGLIDKQRLFIANASHELRTPLTNIKLRSEALLDLGDEEPMVRQRYISEIDSEADRLGRLANTLLDLSRIEAACREPARAAIDLAPVLLAVVKSVRLRMSQAHLTFTAQIPQQLPPLTVWSDQVEAIVLNLLDNAIKYTPPGGKIRFRVTVEQGDCVLRVQDNGPGIPPEDLPYVFDRFYRVDKARSRQSARLGIGSGVGLGLAIVKTLVEQNNGRVQIESVVGQGTTLLIKFPLVVPAQTLA